MLAKSKLNRIEVLISKAIIDSNISHDEFVLVNNVLREYSKMKKEIKKTEKSSLSTKRWQQQENLWIMKPETLASLDLKKWIYFIQTFRSPPLFFVSAYALKQLTSS